MKKVYSRNKQINQLLNGHGIVEFSQQYGALKRKYDEKHHGIYISEDLCPYYTGKISLHVRAFFKEQMRLQRLRHEREEKKKKRPEHYSSTPHGSIYTFIPSELYRMPYGKDRRKKIIERFESYPGRRLVINVEYTANLKDPDLKYLWKKGILLLKREGGTGRKDGGKRVSYLILNPQR